MTVEEIRELIKLGAETRVAELELQRSDNRVRIRFTQPYEGPAFAPPYAAAPPVYAMPQGIAHPAPPPVPPTGPAQPATRSEDSAPSSAAAPDPAVKLVKSPIVGTFYESSAPGSPPFVRVGETVQPGRVLCIIESMKLMNEIEAEFAGVVESKLVPNGAPVEYGEALFSIRPV